MAVAFHSLSIQPKDSWWVAWPACSLSLTTSVPAEEQRADLALWMSSTFTCSRFDIAQLYLEAARLTLHRYWLSNNHSVFAVVNITGMTVFVLMLMLALLLFFLCVFRTACLEDLSNIEMFYGNGHDQVREPLAVNFFTSLFLPLPCFASFAPLPAVI